MGIFEDKNLVPSFGSEFSDNIEDDSNSIVWNTELVDDIIDKVENTGLDLNRVKHPFFEKNINLKKARTAYQMSEYELEEFKKCRKDIIYFSNKYVKLMQEHGVDYIKLHDFQEKMLRMYQNEQFTVVLGSRQVGKCSLATTRVTKVFNGKEVQEPIYKLWWNCIKGQRKFLDYLKYFLYFFYSKLEN